MGWLGKIVEDGNEISRMGLVSAYNNFMKFGNKNDEEAGLSKIWKINGELNIPWLDSQNGRVKSVHEIPKYEGKVIIFVGTSPSLKKSWKALKDLGDRYIIVATNSSAEFLVKRGVYPNYVVMLDGRPGKWTLDLGSKCKNITGLFGTCSEPLAMRAWPGKIMIIPLGVKDRSLNGKIKRRFGKPLPSGGNALNSAVSIFSLLTEAKIFIFVGNDLSFKKTYYADRICDNDHSGYFWSTDIKGEKVKTLIPLYEYKVWLETIMAQLWPEYHFIDCSEGILGIDVDGEVMQFCDHKPLDLAIKEVDDAFEIEARPLEQKLKYLYDEFYEHDLGNIQRGRGMWKHILKMYEFIKGLDVGCGRANGVQWAREQGANVFGCDISSSAVKCWKERGVEEYCKVASADRLPYEDNEFDMVLCSEVMEHIPEENVSGVLNEILRVGSDKFYFTIALVPEAIPVAGLVQSHICLQSTKWWIEKMEEIGFSYGIGAINSEETGFSVLMVKDSLPYQKKDKKLAVSEEGLSAIMVLGTPANDAQGVEFDL